MVLFKIFLSKKSYPNIHQNAPNCIIFKKFLGGACPRTPLAKRMASLFQISKENSCPPPLPNPGDAPDSIVLSLLNLSILFFTREFRIEYF